MSNRERNELLIYYSCLKRFSRFSWKITNIHTIICKKPCHRFIHETAPRKSKLRRRIVSQTTVLVHSCYKKVSIICYEYLSALFEISKANEILSSSFERENRLKLCQATWTTHSHSEKFNNMLKNFANFTRFSVLFSTKKVTGSLVKLSESIFKEFILCFQLYLCSFCTISSGLRVQFRYLFSNLRKIYIYMI